MLFVKLDCGRNVSIDNLDYMRTYECLMEGRPTAELNAHIIELAANERNLSWGKRKLYVIPPAIDVSDPEHPRLPPVLLRAWLTCYQPIDPAFDGSELVVIWLTDECHQEPMEDVIYRGIRGLPWEQLAEDFRW